MFRAPPSRSSPRPGVAGAAPAPSTPRRRLRAWAVGTSALLALLVVVGGVAFGPLVRARAAQEAERRRLELSIGAVRPGLLAVRLTGVRVGLKGVPGLELRLDEVRVELTTSLALRAVLAHGGELRVDGEPEELIERLRAFQKAGGSPAGESGGRRAPVSVDGLSLTWKLPADGEVRGSGLQASRGDDAVRLGAGQLSARYRGALAELVGLEVELAPGGVARRVSATSLSVGRQERPAPAPASPSAALHVEPSPPPLPAQVARRNATSRPGKVAASTPPPASPPPSPPPAEPLLPLPDLHALRARIAAVAATLGSRVPEGSKVEIGGLSVKLELSGDPFAFGPGPFAMERRGDVVKLSFASDNVGAKRDEPGETGKGTPLSVDAELPLGPGDVTARLSGGPVSLALLGVQEGTKGLLDVGKGTVSGKGKLVLSAAGDALSFDGQVALRSISVKQPRLSGEPLHGVDFAVNARGTLDDAGRLRVDDAQLEMGALRVRTHGIIEETKDHFGLSLSADVAPAACQALLDSTPQGLLPLVRSARMSGTFGATARMVFDTRSIDKLVLDYQIDDRCRVSEVPHALSRERFGGAFTYRTYHPDGSPSDTTTGPGTSSWTELENISPHMVTAVLTTEDGAFYRHHGFNHNAIRNSVAANLKARRFVRGASTISMQLTKNLFLARDKTLSRKIEEVILTDYLEQAFRKDDLMELYLNVIEFGPDVYGVKRAAAYYFGRRPEELNLPESFFLASIMPSPIRYGRYLRDSGQVSEGWLRHVRALMEIAAKNGKVSRAELEEGLAQPIVFVRPGDPPPAPRKPVSSSHKDPYEEDSGWQPLE